jgi:hypothetical protein
MTMKKELLYIPIILTGSAIGYFVGIKANLLGWDLYWEVFCGTFLFLNFGVALLELNDGRGVFIGAAVGLLISIALDLIAGSPVEVRNKLSNIWFCSFVGWGYEWGWAYWKPVLIGGLIGGILGIFLGLYRDNQFGYVYLASSMLNTLSLFIQFSILGLGITSLYLKSFGWKYLARHSES